MKLFDRNSSEEKNQLKTGDQIDSSKIRGSHNLASFKRLTPFTGRHKEMHKLIKFLKEKKLIHVCGIHGIGKTRYVAETAYYMHVRS